MKQIESLAEPLYTGGIGTSGDSIYDSHKICRKCRLQYPKSCIRCDDCGSLLASKPRTRKKE